MGEYTIKLPDVGEGVAEAELVEWHYGVGDFVKEDEVIGAVMTDKATVEIPSSVTGKVLWLGGEIGDTLAVGAPLIRLEVDDANMPHDVEEAAPVEALPEAVVEEKVDESKPAAAPAPKPAAPVRSMSSSRPLRAEGEKPLASPSVRKRARENGIDLRRVAASGPAGRITHDDLDAFFQQGPASGVVRAGKQADTSVKDIKVVGLRRKIANKMSIANTNIPHITIVEEVDMEALENLRATMNMTRSENQPKLTVLPFLMRALVKVVGELPQVNAHYDDDAQVVHQYGGVHIGMAAQTPNGLVVPVIKHAEARDVWSCGSEVKRLADASKNGTATKDDLTGSTITITSLGPLGALATTPIINHPEVAILGVNKMQVRPVWDGQAFQPRKMMNISASFDHRIIDGWDAAVFVNKIKTLLETPALIFMEADQ